MGTYAVVPLHQVVCGGMPLCVQPLPGEVVCGGTCAVVPLHQVVWWDATVWGVQPLLGEVVCGGATVWGVQPLLGEVVCGATVWGVQPLLGEVVCGGCHRVGCAPPTRWGTTVCVRGRWHVPTTTSSRWCG